MRREEAGCYLEINLATGNIERVPTDPEEMRCHLGDRNIAVKEACGGFCQHSLRTCLRVATAETKL